MKTTVSILLIVAVMAGTCLAEVIEAPGRRRDVPRQTQANDLVARNSRFAFDLYGQLKETEGNLFFSPVSISAALAMTWAGARGETEKEMAETLHFPLSEQEQLHKEFGAMLERLNKQGQKGDYQLAVANALWGQTGYPFLDSFIAMNDRYYGAGLRNMDFVNAAEPSRQIINRWVEDKTKDKIKDLIPQGVLTAATRLVLTNAIYFKGDWQHQFKKSATKEQPFYLSAEKTVRAPLMYQKERFKYAKVDSLQLVELPYKGGDLSMLVLLPDSPGGLKGLEPKLTAESLGRWQRQMHVQEVEVFLPKFKATSQFNMKKTLEEMGMPIAFSGAADFSGMDGTRSLFIAEVIHKAFVDVNEEGTEAAAATAVVMAEMSMPEAPPVFRADRPFVFILKDNRSGSILFMGRIVDPTQKSE